MIRQGTVTRCRAALALLAFFTITAPTLDGKAEAQTRGPALLDPDLIVRTVVTGLTTPTELVFLGPDDILVTEKNTGRVKRVANGAVSAIVLDLPVNFASERGLLGMALHPQFPAVPSVYLYWTESITGADSSVAAETPLLGNRVDRFLWNGATLSFENTIIRLRARQADAGQVERGNHNGGKLKFGPDGKLYIAVGDLRSPRTHAESALRAHRHLSWQQRCRRPVRRAESGQCSPERGHSPTERRRDGPAG
jgi:glucose/arabinose dehydrogenase